jgi:hypothetical protein
MRLAAPLPVDRRPDFVEAVLAVAAAENGGELGVGVIHRIGAEMQSRFMVRMPVPRREASGSTRQHRARAKV